MIKKLTEEEYKKVQERVMNNNGLGLELRPGQVLYNAIYHINPDVANQLCATDLDPFYHNDRIQKCLDAIKP